MNQDEEQQVSQETPSADGRHVGLSDAFVSEISGLLREQYTDRIQELCRDLPAPDAADLLTHLGPGERRELAGIVGEGLDPETFTYLDRDILNNLLQDMPGPQIAAIVNALDSDDAINLIDDLGEERRGEVMRHLARKVRAAVEEGLTFPEYSAGRLMQREFVAIPQFWTVGKTVDYMRAAAGTLPAKFYDLFIVDPMHKFVGEVSLSHLLCAHRSVKVDTLVREEHVTIPVDMDQEKVAHLFRRKDLLSAPVVDGHDRLIGVITVDDIVDVIDEEAGEDFLKLGGVSDSDIFRPTLSTVRMRFGWLAVNLLTAFAATWVISLYEEEIGKLVALAVLMPIVASMGGNAGTQTLAVTVRALATRELAPSNAWRITLKEGIVGGINGVLFGLVMIAAISFWYGDVRLGLVMAAAMVLNLVAAGFSGALIPIWLARAGFDPAPSAAVFLTTVTDIVGFFAFLGLGAWALL